jgi:hypothetical protein
MAIEDPNPTIPTKAEMVVQSFIVDSKGLDLVRERPCPATVTWTF